MKKLMLLLLLSTAPLVADWLDDIVDMVDKENCFNYRKAHKIIDKYITADKERIQELEDHNQKSTNKTTLEKVVDATTDTAQLLATRTALKYHEGVADYLKRLAQNKEQRDDFVCSCQDLAKLSCKLAKLEVQYARQKRHRDKASLIAQIGLTKAEIATKKAYLKAVKP